MNLRAATKSSNWICLFALSSVVFAYGQTLQGQDSNETQKLKERIEQLEEKLKLVEKLNKPLEKQVESLTNENEQLKRKQPDLEKENSNKQPLTELLVVDTVLKGNFKVSDGRVGEITLTIAEKDGKKIKGTSIVTRPDGTIADREFEGEIKQNSLSVHTIGSAAKFSINVTRKGGGLEGRFSNSFNETGTIGFNLPK
jgi:TolA-binding protein